MAAAIMAVARPPVLGLRSRVGACRQVRWQHMVMPMARGSTMSSAPCQRFHNISYDKTDFSRHNHRFFLCIEAELPALEVLGFPFSPAEIFLRIYHTAVANIHLRSLTLSSSLCPLHHVSSISRFIIIHDNTRRYNRRKIMVVEMRWSKERRCVAAKP